MRRYPHPSQISYSFGPGPLSPAIKAIVWANVAMFLLALAVPRVTLYLGLMPAAVLGRFFLWQPLTYMFLHEGLFHILFNMLTLWMFATELERMWGTPFFLRYYFVTGLGAALTTILLSITPLPFADALYYSLTVGASGAIYGVLLAYGLSFPNRPVYMYLLFPIPAKYFVLILGAVTFLSSIGGTGGGVAHSAHLGGLAVGYLYLKSRGGGPIARLRFRYAKFRMNRMRKGFEVHTGGRWGEWDGKVH
jgi:membrane associated rhomboid family serine protease